MIGVAIIQKLLHRKWIKFICIKAQFTNLILFDAIEQCQQSSLVDICDAICTISVLSICFIF